jgi:hypothetical protein
MSCLARICLTVAAVAALACSPARAWGELGHEVIALVA